MVTKGQIKMPGTYVDLEKSYYPVSINEGDTFDFSLFENKPLPTYTHFDPDTIELLDRDKFETPG
jgi:hypothetical protein